MASSINLMYIVITCTPNVSDVSGVIVLALCVCVCVCVCVCLSVCPSVSLSRLNGETYKLEIWQGCQVKGYLGRV